LESILALFPGMNLTREQQNLVRDILGTKEQQAALTAEIAEHEQRILEMQERQAQLDFLSRQFELLQLIQEHGLNPADILGGLELGVNASLEGLIEAMTAAMTALIEQANAELGIASPSSIFEGMGQRIMEGLAQGISKGISLPVQVMGGLTPALVGQAIGTARQYSFNQIVNNYFPTDATGQGFGAMRALAGA
jgi:hypothetical protein